LPVNSNWDHAQLAKERLAHLRNFYDLLDELERKLGARTLSECSGRMVWPLRGVYFFMEEDENRSDTGLGFRVTRVGTHAITTTSKTTLWNRLSQHRGQEKSGGGNHRGSIFRLLVGTALIAKRGYDLPSWGVGNNAPPDVRKCEHQLECEVSRTIGAMRILWLGIDDFPEATSSRSYIERNVIGLLSNFERYPLDPPTEGWLGHNCNRHRVRRSGLWNQNHVDQSYDPEFLVCLERLISNAEHKK
jgi:hypothetical protein